MIKRLESTKPFTLIIVAPEDEKHPQLNQYLHDLSNRSGVYWLKDYWGEKKTEENVLNKIFEVSELSKEYKDALHRQQMNEFTIRIKAKTA